jgi:hypothetical protein
MRYDSDYYDLSSVNMNDELLSDFPLDLIKENIYEQISNPLMSSTNYFNIVMEKYNIIKHNFSDNPDDFKNFENVIIDFCNDVLNSISEKYNLGIDNIDTPELFPTTEAVYNYFILNYKRNVVRFFYSYITDNRNTLAESYEKMAKKKDVTTLNYKRQLKEREDVIILSNLSSIVSYIKSIQIESLDFVDMTTESDDIDDRTIELLINRGMMNGDFVNDYLDIVFDYNDNVLDEIVNELQLKLYNNAI